MELFMKEKVFSLHDTYHVYDMEGSEKYQIRSKPISITNQTSLYDMEGKELAHIHRKVISMHETHFIEIDGKEVTEVRTKLFHPIHQEIDAPEIGWQIRGNLWDHDFSVLDSAENVRATVHRKWISLGEGYQISIASDEDSVLVLALIVTLERILTDRKNESMTSSSNPSGNSGSSNNS